MVKKLNEYEPRTAKRDSDVTEVLFFLGMLAGAGLIFIVPAFFMEQSTPAENALCFFGGFGAAGLFLALHLKALRRLMVETQAGYWRYLDSLPFAQLKLAALSPELDGNSRESVVEYLTAHYPGWSLRPTLEYSHA